MVPALVMNAFSGRNAYSDARQNLIRLADAAHHMEGILSRKFAAGVVAVIASLAMFGSAWAATSIANGSFEDSMNGWSVVQPVDNVCNDWQSADGNCSVDMGGSPAQGEISQVLATTAGTTYTVTFALAGNPSCTPGNVNWVGWVSEPGVKNLRVTASPAVSTQLIYSFDVTGKSYADMGWTSQAFVFTADSAATTLTFQNVDNNWCGPVIDNVSISGGGPTAVVPASAEDCKKGGWAALTDHLGNKFKNQGDCVSYVATAGKNKGAIAP